MSCSDEFAHSEGVPFDDDLSESVLGSLAFRAHDVAVLVEEGVVVQIHDLVLRSHFQGIPNAVKTDRFDGPPELVPRLAKLPKCKHFCGSHVDETVGFREETLHVFRNSSIDSALFPLLREGVKSDHFGGLASHGEGV